MGFTRSSIIRERIAAGIARARTQGHEEREGIRPTKDIPEREDAVRASLAPGTGFRKTARLIGTGNATVARIAAEMRAD
jgi:DNA invertase Pin-like site-specific DNA recombinase